MSVIVSEFDPREYRSIKLDNELEALLIHDATADKVGAAMDVRSGYWKDPKETQGLAHFCEHMMFLGTEKHPEEKAYNSFLSAHGGTYNAFTMATSTTYMFEITADHLDAALDMFAQFFIAPLFTESGTSREVEAIQSEHSKNLQSDDWRIQHLSTVIASPDHPSSKFSTGSSKTLQVHADLREQVVKFWRDNYSSNIMKLVVLGKESLDDLERSVREKFSAIENRKLIQPLLNGIPYERSSLGSRLVVVPIRQRRRLSFMWPLPALRTFFRTKPENYLSHLIGHEAEGSILSYLKERGWAEGLLSGTYHESDHSMMKVHIELTIEGEKHIDEIVDIVYAYIALIKDHGIAPDLYEEVRIQGDLAFRFKEKEAAFTFVCQLSNNMQNYPTEYVLFGPSVNDKYDETLIKSIAAHLEPSNMILTLSSPTFKKVEGSTETEMTPNLIEEHYGIEYRKDKLSPSMLERWQSILASGINDIGARFLGLEVPKPNPFMPTDFSVLPKLEDKNPASPPEIILDTPTLRLWHKQDQTFLRPRTNLFLDFITPCIYHSPMSVVKTKVFIDYVEESLAEYGYDAQLAGLKYTLTLTTEGFVIAVSGYSCKQFILLEKILSRLKNTQIEPERFELVRQRTLKNYQNIGFSAPYTMANYQMSLFLENPKWNYKQYVEAVENLKPQCIQSWIPQVLDALYVEVLAIGNISTSQALAVSTLLETTFHPKPILTGQFQQTRMVHLDHEVQYWIQHLAPSADETNSAVISHYQVGPTCPKSTMLIELINQLLGPLLFDQLRTQEQLGYIVASVSRTTLSIDYWWIVVQSAKYDPVHIDSRIEAWISTVGDYLKELPTEVFEQNRLSLIHSKREKFTSLRKEAIYYLDYINSPHTYNFDNNEKEAKVLEKITIEDVINCWDTYIAHDAPQRKKLSSQVWPKSKSPYLPPSGTNLNDSKLTSDAVAKIASEIASNTPISETAEDPIAALSLDDSTNETMATTTANTVTAVSTLKTPIRLLKDPFIFKGRMPLYATKPMGKERVTPAEYTGATAAAQKH